VPEHCALETHWTHVLFEQCGLTVGQSMSAMHCTHPGVSVIAQSTGLVPASPPLELPLEPLLEASAGAPLDPLLLVLLALPPFELLVVPLEEPLSDRALEDSEPPSELVSEPLELQPIPTAMTDAMERPRHFLNDDMAGLSSYPAPRRKAEFSPTDLLQLGQRKGTRATRMQRSAKWPSTRRSHHKKM
jgi:hypothetical protein